MNTMPKDIHVSKKITHICMPVLFIIALLVLRVSKREGRLIIYYDILPRYLRGVTRIFHIPLEKFVSVLSIITGLPIQKIKHGDDVPDYPHLHLKAMETVTAISEQLITEMKLSNGILCLKKVIGNEPAKAYTAKYLSQYQLFPYVLPVVSNYKSLQSPEDYFVVWNLAWPANWNQSIQKNLKWIKFKTFKCPGWYLYMQRSLGKIAIFLAIPVITLRYIMKRGVTSKSVAKKHFKVITEFIDPKRLNQTAYDADYWIDNDKINNDDILFFLTNNQKRYLISNGYSTKDIIKLFNDKKYELAILNNLSYTFYSLKFLFILYIKLIPSIFKLKNFISCLILSKAWSEYIQFLPLFLHYSSKSLIYITFPNGYTGLRYDDAIVTALCRENGIKSYGCQTRTIYANKFEDCFDCFDIYFSWGTAWAQISSARMLFIKKSMTVGCIYLDHFLPLYSKHLESIGNKQKKMLTISIFPSDISHIHHYTINYTKSLLMNCATLAKKFPQYNFIIKSKNSDYTKIMMDEKDFYEAYCNVGNNFSFVDQAKYDYANVLFDSDIVIAIGFTTPGAEALLLGKRAIYFSELRCGGQAFRHIPFLVADSEKQMEEHFSRALLCHLNPAEMDMHSLDKLDPFRDGRSLSRIQGILLDI